MRLKLLLIIFVITLISIVLIFLHFQYYSINDINADNYKRKLKETNESIWNSGIDNYIPDNINLLTANQYSLYQTNGIKIDKVQTNATRTRIGISNVPSNLLYYVYFENNKIPVALAVENLTREYNLQKIFDKLILKEGFVLSKSELIHGDDILIKEDDNNFIIVNISTKYDDINLEAGFGIETYSKRKFF